MQTLRTTLLCSSEFLYCIDVDSIRRPTQSYHMEDPYPQRQGRKTGPSSRDTFAQNEDNQQAWFGEDVTPMGGCKACQTAIQNTHLSLSSTACE